MDSSLEFSRGWSRVEAACHHDGTCAKAAIVPTAGLRVAPATTARLSRRSVVVKADLKGIESQYKQFRIPEIPVATIAGIAG